MRKRAHTTAAKAPVQTQDIHEEYQKLKIEFSLLRNKSEQVQKEKNILKQGNTNLISEFLFSRNRQEISKLSALMKEKTQENTELKTLIAQLQKLLQNMKFQPQNEQTRTYEHSSKFTIRIKEEKLNQDSSNSKSHKIFPSNLKNKIVELKQSYEHEIDKNTQLEEENFNLGQEIQLLRTSLQQLNKQVQRIVPDCVHSSNEAMTSNLNKLIQENEQLRSENDNLQKTIDKNKEQSKIRQTESEVQNKELSQKVKSLQIEIKKRKQSFDINSDQRLSMIPPRPVLFSDTDINMSVSICQTEDMKKSLIYEKLSESSLQQSFVTESYDKRLSKLQKMNSSLQKDYKAAQQKIKTLNRQYSKLKLDYLKLIQQSKLKEDEYLNKIQILNNRIEAAYKRAKQQQDKLQTLKNQKEKQKSSLKSIIVHLQSAKVQQQNSIQKLKIQSQNLKSQLQQNAKIQQRTVFNTSQLQYERSRNKQLQKQLQTKSKQFEKTFKEYEKMIQDMRRIGAGSKQDKMNSSSLKDQKSSSSSSLLKRSSQSPFGRKKLLTDSNSKQPSQLQIGIQSQTIFKSLKSQIQLLRSNLQLQNERCNILENSNKELRKQLVKMIDQEQKLRKDLVGEKVKNKTKSISSRNSRTFSTKRLREDFGDQKQQGKLNQSSSNLELNIGMKQSKSPYNQNKNTDRSFDSTQVKFTLHPSSSVSQLRIPNQQSQPQPKFLNSTVKPQTSYLKTMRQRRFDPQQTANVLPVKEISLTERSNQNNQTKVKMTRNNGNLTQRRNISTQKESSNNLKFSSPPSIVKDSYGMSQMIYPVVNIDQKKITPIHGQIKKNILQSSQDISNWNKVNPIDKTSQQKQIFNKIPNVPTKYVYQPPKKYIPGLAMVKSITQQNEKQIDHSKEEILNKRKEKEDDLLTLSNDNNQITLEISSSKSNFSKRDTVMEPNLDEIKTKPKIPEEPQSARKVETNKLQDQGSKQTKNNFVLTGKIQTTKSNAQVRFARKNQ